MNTLVVFLLFVGIMLVMHGVYQDQLERARKEVKIEYRFIPRTLYEEQLSATPDVFNKFKNMFDYEGPWTDRAIGKDLGFKKSSSKASSNARRNTSAGAP